MVSNVYGNTTSSHEGLADEVVMSIVRDAFDSPKLVANKLPKGILDCKSV